MVSIILVIAALIAGVFVIGCTVLNERTGKLGFGMAAFGLLLVCVFLALAAGSFM